MRQNSSLDGPLTATRRLLGRMSRMKMKMLNRVVLLLALASPALADTADFKQMITRGIALHDQGRYEEAIAIYRDVLRQDPENETAMYELTYSLLASRAFEECATLAEKALKTSKTRRALFYTVAGNCLDSAGSGDKAVEIYKRGLSEFPTEPGLAFNLGVTQYRLERFKEAQQLAKISIRARPNHASSHFLLAQAYAAGGYNVPALLAALRFLSLEPSGQRAAEAAALARDAFNHGVVKKSDKNVSVFIESQAPKDEGDFSSVSMTLSLLAAVRFTEAGAKKSDIESLAEQVTGLMEFLGEKDVESTSFVKATYVPFLTAVHRAGVAVPFTYFVFSSLKLKGTVEWTDTHKEDMEKLKGVLQQFNGAKTP